MLHLTKKHIIFFSLLICLIVSITALSQNKSSKDPSKGDNRISDTGFPPAVNIDSIASDSIPRDSITDTAPKEKKSKLTTVVNYQSKDSIIFTGTGVGYLFGEGKVTYDQIGLDADYIRMNLDSSVVYATGRIDTAGKKIGYPIFKDKDDTYNSESITYNFNTGKGYITNVVTQQGDGYITSGKTKKMPDGSFFMSDGKYTTCDLHDHPHFYIDLTKAKVRPKKNVVTGPAYVVVEDVPLPLAFPFAFFPFTDKYSSGVIMPKYGEESVKGFYLRDGGYYFAINDNLDLALTGDIYTKGSWGLKAFSNYVKRYKFRGSFSTNYIKTIYGDKLAGDYQEQSNYSLVWQHSQDPKANPNRSLSADVNFSTSGYNRNELNQMYNASSYTTNTKTSGITYGIRMFDNQLTLNTSARVTQRSQDSTVNLSLPTLSLSTTTLYPFKRKNAIGSERWYEKISFSYQGMMENSIQTKENLLFKSNLIKDWRNGIDHKIPVQASFILFNNINVTPSLNYEERWYGSKTGQQVDNVTGKIVRDTIYGFNRVYNYSFSISAGTILYGFYKPLPSIFGKKVEMIRHTFKPSISYSMAPDFGSSRYGYYGSYTYLDTLTNKNVTRDYSYYDGYLYGVPGRGRTGNISFTIDNTLEMKVKSDKDSTGVKKISIFDKLSVSSGYNLALDSLNWNYISLSLAVKISKSYNLNVSATLDPYVTVGDVVNGKQLPPVRINTTHWQRNHTPGSLTSMTFSIPALSWNNNTFKKKKDNKQEKSENQNYDPLNPDPLNPDTPPSTSPMEDTSSKALNSDGYAKWDIPWNFNLNYNISLGRGSYNYQKQNYDLKWVQSLSFSGNVQFSKNWRFNFSSNYNFDAKEFGYTTCAISRDLHCWSMSASFVPVGPSRSYNFTISVKSSLLQDLKYEQRSSPYSNMNWY